MVGRISVWSDQVSASTPFACTPGPTKRARVDDVGLNITVIHANAGFTTTHGDEQFLSASKEKVVRIREQDKRRSPRRIVRNHVEKFQLDGIRQERGDVVSVTGNGFTAVNLLTARSKNRVDESWRPGLESDINAGASSECTVKGVFTFCSVAAARQDSC